MYPFGYEERAKRVRERLGLKVDCPGAIQEGTIARLDKWVSARKGVMGV